MKTDRIAKITIQTLRGFVFELFPQSGKYYITNPEGNRTEIEDILRRVRMAHAERSTNKTD